jgi:hypothetical protein
MAEYTPDISGLIHHDCSFDRVVFSADTHGQTRQGARYTAAMLIGGSTLLLGVLGIMGAVAGGPGWLVVFGLLWLFVIGFVTPGLLEIERMAAPKTIEISGDTVTVKSQLLRGVRTETYPAEHDLAVKWLVVEPTEPRYEPRYHIELVGIPLEHPVRIRLAQRCAGTICAMAASSSRTNVAGDLPELPVRSLGAERGSCERSTTLCTLRME